MSDDAAKLPDAWIEFGATFIYDLHRAGILYKIDDMTDDDPCIPALDGDGHERTEADQREDGADEMADAVQVFPVVHGSGAARLSPYSVTDSIRRPPPRRLVPRRVDSLPFSAPARSPGQAHLALRPLRRKNGDACR